MSELTSVGTTPLRVYSRNNSLPLYADPVNNVVFTGLNIKSAPVTSSASDQKYVIDARYAFRPDLLSYRFYKTPLLGWYICSVNDIVDPFDPETGLFAGRQVIIPAVDYVYRQLI